MGKKHIAGRCLLIDPGHRVQRRIIEAGVVTVVPSRFEDCLGGGVSRLNSRGARSGVRDGRQNFRIHRREFQLQVWGHLGQDPIGSLGRRRDIGGGCGGSPAIGIGGVTRLDRAQRVEGAAISVIAMVRG